LAVRDDWHGEGNQVVDRRAVIGVAAVAAVVSYEHAYSLIRAHGETGWTAHLIQVTVDGLIWASSMFMLDSARSGVRVSALARWLLGLGIAATLAANVAHGLGHGLIGSAIAAIRARAAWTVSGAREAEPVPGLEADPFQVRAAEEFADQVAAGTVPSIRAIRARLHVCQPRAQHVRAHLCALADPPREHLKESVEGISNHRIPST
jgi:hypothetical protein